jgi:hypothetical protein
MRRVSSAWWKQPLWWKTKEFLWSLFALCFLIVTGITSPILYDQHLSLKEKKERLRQLQTYVTSHESTVKLVEKGLKAPTKEELALLQAKVPTEVNLTKVVEVLQKTANKAGVKWRGIRFAASEAELEKLQQELKMLDSHSLDLKTSLEYYLFTNKEENKEKASTKYLSQIYADVYLDSEPGQLKAWFQAIKDLERIIHIREWDSFILNKEENKIGNTRVRFILYVYLDPKLELNSLENKNSDVTEGSSTQIEILPKQTEEEKEVKKNQKQKSGTIDKQKTKKEEEQDHD